MAGILQVSSRTVDLTTSLSAKGIFIKKEGKKYFLSGQLDILSDFQATEEYTPSQRQTLLTYELLTEEEAVTNEQVKERFLVSNVTVIQDVAIIEKRLKDFDLVLSRQRGYSITGSLAAKRLFLAILLANSIAIQEFWSDEYAQFGILESTVIHLARSIFEAHQDILGDTDSKLKEFLIILLGLADNRGGLLAPINVSKGALDFSQKMFAELAKKTKRFYNIQEIIYFANIVDEVVLKRREVPLFREKFDSEFYYSISQMIDTVARFTKIDFFKYKLLFKFLFNHIRLSLAVPILFPESATHNVAYHNQCVGIENQKYRSICGMD